jgi:hypothetical protein
MKLTKKLKKFQLLKTLLKPLMLKLTQTQSALLISQLKLMLKKLKLPILTNPLTVKRKLKNLEKTRKVKPKTNFHFKINLRELS